MDKDEDLWKTLERSLNIFKKPQVFAKNLEGILKMLKGSKIEEL